jgi:hypothetical protein
MIWVPHFEDGRENAHEAAEVFGADIGCISIKTLAAQIWVICAAGRPAFVPLRRNCLAGSPNSLPGRKATVTSPWPAITAPDPT